MRYATNLLEDDFFIFKVTFPDGSTYYTKSSYIRTKSSFIQYIKSQLIGLKSKLSRKAREFDLNSIEIDIIGKTSNEDEANEIVSSSILNDPNSINREPNSFYIFKLTLPDGKHKYMDTHFNKESFKKYLIRKSKLGGLVHKFGIDNIQIDLVSKHNTKEDARKELLKLKKISESKIMNISDFIKYKF